MMAPVMFLHVPGSIEDHDIDMGKKVALGLIGAMVASTTGTNKGHENVAQ